MRKILSMTLVVSMILTSITISPIFVKEAKAETTDWYLEHNILNQDKLKSDLVANDIIYISDQGSYDEIKYRFSCNDDKVTNLDALDIKEWLKDKYAFSSAFIGYDKDYADYGKYRLTDGQLKSIEYKEEIPIIDTKIRNDNNYTIEYKGNNEGKWFKVEENRGLSFYLAWENENLVYKGFWEDIMDSEKDSVFSVTLDVAQIKECNSSSKSYTIKGIYDENRAYWNEYYIYASTNSDNSIKDIYGCYSFYTEDELRCDIEKESVYVNKGGNAKLNTNLIEAKASQVDYQWYKLALTEDDKEKIRNNQIRIDEVLTDELLEKSQIIQNATKESLVLFNIDESDYGAYACKVTDDLDNKLVIGCYLKELKIGDVDSDRMISKAIEYSHTLFTNIIGAANSKGELYKEKIDVTTNLNKILSKNEYKYVWLRRTYNGFENNKIDVPKLSDECLETYIDSNRESISLMKDEVKYSASEDGITILQCYAVPKDKYYNDTSIKNALKNIENNMNSTTTIEELREAEMELALELTEEGKKYSSDYKTLNFLPYHLVDIDYPLGRKNSEYLENIYFRSSDIQKNYIVQAKLGDELNLYNIDIQTTYPLSYYWEYSYVLRRHEKDLVLSPFEIQDYSVDSGYTFLSCPHELNSICENGNCPVQKHACAKYNLINISDLSVTGNVENKGNNAVDFNVSVRSSSPLREYKWYKRTVGNTDEELSGDTSTINIQDPGKYTGKDVTGSVSYVCKVSDGFKQEEVIFNVRDNQSFSVNEETQSVNTNAVFNYVDQKDTELTLNPNVTVGEEYSSNNIVYEWYKDGEKLPTTASSVDAIYPDEGASIYEVRIKDKTDTAEINTVSIKYILRPTWENNRIDITKDMSDNSSSDSENSGSGSSSSGGSSNSGSSSGGSSGGGSGSSGGGSSSGDTNSEENKTENSKDETPKDDENKEETNDNGTTPSKDAVQSQPTQTAENQVVKETEQIIKDIEENKVSDKVISEETANNIKEAIKEGKEIVTNIVSQSIKKEDITQHIVTKINNVVKKLSTKAKIAEYLNLEVQLKADDKVLGNINELSKPIDFTVKIPDSLKATNRKYFVLRVHNGLVEKLDTVVNEDGTLSFKTDKFSTYVLAYEDVTKPGTVKNLKVMSGTKSIKLSWTKDKNATGYRVFIAKNGKWVKLVDTKSNSYYSNNFAAGTSLKFAVKAYYKSELSLSWADKNTSINTCTKPSKVTGFTAKAASRTAVATTWKKTNGATGYRVYVAKNGKWIQVATTRTNKYTFKGLKRNTKYKFAVRAYKTVGNKTVLADSYAYINTRTKK